MIDVVGTSHIAGEDLDRIRQRVEEKEPDVVALELDPGRLDALLHHGRERRPRNPFFMLLAWLQDVLGRRTGVAPGSDMLEAFHAARDEGIDVALIDQDIAVTLQKLKQVPLREKVKFAGFLLLAPFLFSGPSINLRRVPGQEVVQEMLLRFRVGFPEMFRVLVTERNAVMVERLQMLDAEYDDVLAVVGAGHVDGIRDSLLNTET